MRIFLTGSTGFLGGEMLVSLSKKQEVEKIYCLIRAHSQEEADKRINHVFELHGDYYDRTRVIPVIGNLSDEHFTDNLSSNSIIQDTNVVIHSAANTSFSKIYDDLVEKVNIQGLKKVLKWAKKLENLNTFLYIGTATICGKDVKNRTVLEDESPNLNASHLVKYTYTKMMGELLIREHLPQEKILIARPSIIMGDSRPLMPRSAVILWALATVNYLRLIPVNQYSRLDIISVDWAANAIVELLFSKRKHNVYHISSGEKASCDAYSVTKKIEAFFTDRPEFCFIDRAICSQMKNWARDRMTPDSELNNYKTYLEYWDELLENKSDMRILLAGLEPYLDFMELGHIFDNSRLLEDVNIPAPTACHDYIVNSLEFMRTIDIFDGAIDP